MKKITVTPPEVAFIAGTRVALGSGLALLLGDRLGRKQRRKIGWALFMTGAVTTIPLAMIMLSRRH